MTMTDPIADLLARIRNAQAKRHASLGVPFSNAREAVLKVLTSEGYIRGYTKETVRDNIMSLKVDLKYTETGEPAIQEIKKISKPGRRVYSSVTEFKPVHSGLGINIISTSRGVMSDVDARKLNIGGEVICQVF